MTYHRNDVVNQRDVEERWSLADSMRIAEAEFYRSRRRAAIRALKLKVEEGRFSIFESGRDGRRFDLPLTKIAGIVLPNGELSRGLPPLPRRMEKAWLESFARSAVDEGRDPFACRLVEGGLYLEGGANELMRLEVRRAKGEKSVLAFIKNPTAIGCVECPGIPACPLAC